MCLIMEKSLYRENKALKKEIDELKERIKTDKDILLLEVVNTYMKDKDLYKDFEEYIHRHIGKIFQETNELKQIWDNLK